MTIKQTPVPDKSAPQAAGEEQQKPLLNITLPAPPDMNPRAPLSVGAHNASAQKNFKQVANIMQALVTNQKLMSLAITEANKKIKRLEKSNKAVAKNIRKLLGNKNEQPTTAS